MKGGLTGPQHFVVYAIRAIRHRLELRISNEPFVRRIGWSNHMTGKTRAKMFEAINGIAVRREPARLSRREAVRLVGGIGLATAGVIALGRSAGAFQEASPVPSPVLGPQADGTTLWKVAVGGMDMENFIEY